MKRKCFAILSAAVLCGTMLAAPVQSASAVSYRPESVEQCASLLGHQPDGKECLCIPLGEDLIVEGGVTSYPVCNEDGEIVDMIALDGVLMVWEDTYGFLAYKQDDDSIPAILYPAQEVLVYDITADKPLTEADFADLGEQLRLVTPRNAEAGTYKYQMFFADPEEPGYELQSIAAFYRAYDAMMARTDIKVQVHAYFLQQTAGHVLSTYGLGDINEDEQINVCDAILMSRIAAGEQGVPVTDKGKDNGDMNYDGVITAEDVMLLLKKLAKK